MAVFRQQRVTGIPFGIYEVPGKLYIEGQAHDPTTLAPIFNDSISIIGNFNRGALPLLPQKAKSYIVGNTTYSSTITNTATLDCNQGILRHNKLSSTKPDTLFIPPTRHNSSWGGTAINSKTNNVIASWNNITGSYEGSSYIFNETGANLFCMTHNSVDQNYSGQANVSVTRIYKADTTTLASSSIIASASNGTFGTHQYQTLVHESENDYYFLWEGSTGSNSSAITYASADTTRLFTISKTGVYTNKSLAARTSAQFYPTYRPTKAVTVSGNQRALWAPLVNNANLANGDSFAFTVIEFDVSVGVSGATSTVVNPTGVGVGTQPGMSLNSLNMQYQAWTFEVNGFNYICVGASNNTGTTITNNLEANYIHVYKSPIGSPRTISYVSSIQMSASTKAHGIMPIDADWKNLVVPYAGQGLDFFTWSQGTESYVKTSSVTMDPAFLMVDQTGRLWVAEGNSGSSLHVFSPTISATVRVGFQDPALRYTGTEISSNLLISTFNFEGARIANNVTLQIDSVSATFADGTLTKTVTTSPTGDLLVPIKIKGAGYIRVLANLAI
jgi:hypothetical protein